MTKLRGHARGQSGAQLADDACRGCFSLKQYYRGGPSRLKHAWSPAPSFPRRSAPGVHCPAPASAQTTLTTRTDACSTSDEVAARPQEPHPGLSSAWRVRGLPLPEMQRRRADAVPERVPAQHAQAQGAPQNAHAIAAQRSTAVSQNHASSSLPGNAAPATSVTARPHNVASALGLMAVALLFIPLLLLLGHAEVATFGLVVGISRLTGIGVAVAAATRWRSSSTAGSSTSGGSSNRSGSGLGPEDSRAHGNRWAGAAVALGYIVPLPHQVVLQLAAVGAVLLPLGLSLGAAVWSAASGAPCGRWLKASLLYALGLLLPSPGVGRPVQRINLGAQACRALLLWGAGCLVAAEVSAAAAGAAVAGSGVQAAAVVATVARLWLWLAGVMWSLQTLGWLEATVSSW